MPLPANAPDEVMPRSASTGRKHETDLPDRQGWWQWLVGSTRSEAQLQAQVAPFCSDTIDKRRQS